MSELLGLTSTLSSKLRSLSMGLKLVMVCGLAILMMIPAMLVYALISDRTQRKLDVIREISDHVGGQQIFLGPVLAIPWRILAKPPAYAARQGMYLVFPDRASAVVKTVTEERRRSLFQVPVFQADLKLDAAFDLTGVPTAAPEDAELDWSRGQVLIGVSDARGALADAVLTTSGKALTLAPAGVAGHVLPSNQNPPLTLTLFGTGIGDLVKPSAQFSVSAALRFSGAQRIAVLAYGKTTHLMVQGDWPSPGFDGGFLPVSRSVRRDGFSADWSVPYIARGVRAEGPSDSITGLDATALGVSFVAVADPYQSVSRSLKYAPLFLGLVFLSYFIFEVATGRRVHPAQYILVGVAQIIFYLLLLSFAERIGFDFAFLVAGAATVGLLSANASWVFASRLQGIRSLVIFTMLYLLIYTLLRLEDNALLVGAIASFTAVAAAMYSTRAIDWYSPFPKAQRQASSSLEAAPGADHAR